ncbi:MAG: hypothetical protein WAW85_15855 [Gordonia sp. (in: high G+C Gram-positive bacteria)]|uniref:hypothetical protein n=1 Tax=Gordonia sp. (in: high G+C Gram-positive bacteria) TaxID=84139 RepID=UPI003BB5E9D1
MNARRFLASLGIAATLASAGTTIPQSALPQAEADTISWGAIAYKFSYGRTDVGRAWGYPSHAAAKKAARAKVGGNASRVNSVCSFG